MNHVCPKNAKEIHRKMYNYFIDKVKDSRKIVFNDYMKIVDEIVEEHPECGDYFFDAVLGGYGWDRVYVEEDKNLYMIKSDCPSNAEINVNTTPKDEHSNNENLEGNTIKSNNRSSGCVMMLFMISFTILFTAKLWIR